MSKCRNFPKIRNFDPQSQNIKFFYKNPHFGLIFKLLINWNNQIFLIQIFLSPFITVSLISFLRKTETKMRILRKGTILISPSARFSPYAPVSQPIYSGTRHQINTENKNITEFLKFLFYHRDATKTNNRDSESCA